MKGGDEMLQSWERRKLEKDAKKMLSLESCNEINEEQAHDT